MAVAVVTQALIPAAALAVIPVAALAANPAVALAEIPVALQVMGKAEPAVAELSLILVEQAPLPVARSSPCRKPAPASMAQTRTCYPRGCSW